ncbi:MAG: hypothetical protein WBN93_11420 [Acidimicrobiia bacterium]
MSSVVCRERASSARACAASTWLVLIALSPHGATLPSERVVRYEWPGTFTEVYSPAHSDFRPSYCEEPELWFGFEIELATSDPEACDRVVIGIRR